MTEMETVETVFGNGGDDKGRIPEQARGAFEGFLQQYGLTTQKDSVRQKYVDLVNTPVIAARGDEGPTSRWLTAARSIRAQYAASSFGSKGRPFAVMPLSVQNRPMKFEDQKTGATKWNVKMFGIAKSLVEEAPFEGPANLTVYGYTDENSARRLIDNVVARKLYHVRATVHKDSPTGILGPGKPGTLSLNAGDPFDAAPPAENGGPWSNPFAVCERVFPVVRWRDIFATAEKNTSYLVNGYIAKGAVFNKNGVDGGSLTILDDSISGDGALLTEMRGGPNVFLARDDIVRARLAPGSMVKTIVSGYQRDKKDPTTQQPTGGKEWVWSSLALEVTLDLTPGGGIPEPEKAAVRLPTRPSSPAPVPAARDL